MPGCEISVIIPVYNDQTNLNRILKELQANQPDDTWELIIVDDGSLNKLKLTTDTPASWTLIYLDEHQGAAVGRNAGVKKARGKHVVFLSVFLSVPDTYISQIKIFIAEHNFDFAQHLLEKAPGLETTNFQTFLLNQEDRISTSGESLPIKQSLFTAAITEKEIFCKLKGFDETMQHYGGHEMDLIYRMDQAGYKMRIPIDEIPLQRVSVETHETIRSRLQEYARIGLPALLKKHPRLEKTILTYPVVWSLLSILDIPSSLERRFRRRIEQDIKLTRIQYRLYLHLIVRNAWDAR